MSGWGSPGCAPPRPPQFRQSGVASNTIHVDVSFVFFNHYTDQVLMAVDTDEYIDCPVFGNRPFTLRRVWETVLQPQSRPERNCHQWCWPSTLYGQVRPPPRSRA